ncbi:MAG TPA: hypothetical protein VKA14_03020 [Gammaproteobacteria bacterium]|nr:hypothetical protein [Gammaproteobacteria bacterium]
MESDLYQRLKTLLGCPTAPFREQQVRELAAQWLDRWRVPHFQDPAGNLVVGVDGPGAYRRLVRARSGEPVRLFIAHMDHPGFHGTRWLDARHLEIKWHGGSPVKHLAGARVWLSAGDGYAGEGTLHKATLLPSGRAMDRAQVRVAAGALAGAKVGPRRLFGGFAFRAPVWRAGQRIYTKAADDLVGVFCILETARGLYSSRRRRPPFIGLLTRGEEVGFVGAMAHLELGWWRGGHRGVLAVSLEASRTLPGARVGRGPVVRLGDRRTVFDPDGLKVLSDLAEGALPGRHQSRLMDGGACEATAATVFGLPAVGLSVPLGNYHNQGFEGGADCRAKDGPAPEFVHLSDIDGQLRLCQALMRPRLGWRDPWREQRGRLGKNRAGYRRLLGA